MAQTSRNPRSPASVCARKNNPDVAVGMSVPIDLPFFPTSRIFTFAVGVLPFSCTPTQRPASLPCAITTNRAVTSLTTVGLLTMAGVPVSAEVVPDEDGDGGVVVVPPVAPAVPPLLLGVGGEVAGGVPAAGCCAALADAAAFVSVRIASDAVEPK